MQGISKEASARKDGAKEGGPGAAGSGAAAPTSTERGPRKKG